MNPTWNQPTYSMQPQLQLEQEFDLPMDTNTQNQQTQSLFPNSTYPPPQNFSFGFTTANGHVLSTGGQQGPSRSLSYGSGSGSTDGRQTNGFLATSTESGHQQNFDSHSSPDRNGFNPTLPSYYNNQSYSIGTDPYRQFGNQDASGSNLTATGLAEKGIPSPPFVTSPVREAFSTQELLPHPQSYGPRRPDIDTSGRFYGNKRQRGGEDADELKDEAQDESLPAEPHAKTKGPGACARCKNLKVKCEFKGDADFCKRCMNGGHECTIPGRKKRRTPPKREHLLNQIREQAAQITKLMQELEIANSQRTNSDPNSPGSNQHSPVLDPEDDADPPRAPKPEVEDWMAKARESIEAFGGFIGIGGAGMPKNLLVNEEFEDSESSGIDSDEYEFAVQDSEGSLVDIEGSEGPSGGRTNLRKTPSREYVKRSRSGERRGSLSSPGGSMRQKLMALPSGAVPFGLMANLALKKRRGHSKGPGSDVSDDDENNVGVANEEFFSPSPGPDVVRNELLNKVKQQGPHILTRGLITPKEAEKLFDIYFTNMNLSVSLLDPVLYTAQKTCLRSPFLFTVICAIASRHYSERPELYSQAMRYAQLAAGTALISGHKSVEMVSGYILLSLYPMPARRWEDDRNWLYLGLAIRIATDLNLHHPNTVKPLNEQHAREMLNRTRVWLNCFNLDRSTGSQYGKPPIIKNTDYIAMHSEDWWDSSEYNLKHFDIHISAYNAELKIMAGFIAQIYSDPEHPTGLNKEADFEKIATETDDKLVQVGEKWFARLAKTDLTDPQNCFRTGLLRLAYSYARLIALSFGFQHAFGKSENGTDENPFLLRCLRAASDVVKAVVNDVGRPSQRIYLRHGPDAQSVFLTFASAFLVKLLQPKFASYLTMEQRVESRALVQQVVDLLGSKEVAIDDRHGPKLYSRFLKGLLAAPMAKVDPQSPGSKAAQLNNQKRRGVTRGKSTSSAPTPDYERHFDFSSSAAVFDLPSPASTTLSLSPQPNHAAISFDQFAPVSVGIDPFFAGRAPETQANQSDHVMNMPDFFSPPLPFDNDILQSMQSLSEDWAEIPPGFGWITQFPDRNEINMKSDDFPDHYQMS